MAHARQSQTSRHIPDLSDLSSFARLYVQGLAALGLEPAESRAGLPLRARLRSRARDATAPNDNPGLLGALLNGVVGILSEPVRHVVHEALLRIQQQGRLSRTFAGRPRPVRSLSSVSHISTPHAWCEAYLNLVISMLLRCHRGAEQGGVPGLLRGASRGAAGALVQPLAFALETSVAVADSLRSAIMGIPPMLPRARPPRHVVPGKPLAVYNWSEVGALVLPHA